MNTNETNTQTAPAAAPAAPKVKATPKPMFSSPIHKDDKDFLEGEAKRLGGISLKAALTKIIAHYKATVDLTVVVAPTAEVVITTAPEATSAA